jgi:hypothetical protein
MAVEQQRETPEKLREALRSANREMTASTSMLMYQIDVALSRMETLDRQRISQ